MKRLYTRLRLWLDLWKYYLKYVIVGKTTMCSEVYRIKILYCSHKAGNNWWFRFVSLFFCGIFQKLVDMALSISPFPCTASGQLRRNLYLSLFPWATSQVAACRHLATAARVKYPAALQRCKFDTPLLAAGSLIFAEDKAVQVERK